MADLGVIEIHLDDVCVSDLVHAVLTIIDLIQLNQDETHFEVCDECEFQNTFLVWCHVTSSFSGSVLQSKTLSESHCSFYRFRIRISAALFE